MGRKQETALKASLESTKAALAAKSSELASAVSSIGALKAGHKAATEASMKEKVQLATLLKKAQHRQKEAERSAGEATGRVASLEAGLTAAKAEVTSRLTQAERSDAELGEARAAVRAARDAQTELQAQIAALKESSRTASAAAAKAASSSGSGGRGTAGSTRRERSAQSSRGSSTRSKSSRRAAPATEATNAALPSVDMSGRLVEEAAKNMKLGLECQAARGERDALMAEIVGARTVLLNRMLTGSDVDIDKYSNVKFTNLVRIWIDNTEAPSAAAPRMVSSGADGGAPAPRDSFSGTFAGSSSKGSSSSAMQKPLAAAQSGRGGGETATVVINTNRSEVQTYKRRCLKLQSRIDDLEDSLTTAETITLKVEKLRERSNEYATRLTLEKDRHGNTKGELMASNERLVMLSEHVEKLMVHLKHEAAAKVKAESVVKRFERDAALLRQKGGVLRKRTIVQKRALSELREGSKILEDQLRLMDEKYIELRSKLDWTRSSAKREVSEEKRSASFPATHRKLPSFSLHFSSPFLLYFPSPSRSSDCRKTSTRCEGSGRWQEVLILRFFPRNLGKQTVEAWAKSARWQQHRRMVR